MANTLYNNFIINNKIKSIIDTKLEASRLFQVNNELQAEPGMIYKVHKYISDAGKAEILATGQGNSKTIEAGYTEETYNVGTIQDKTKWYDEDAMTDPVLVDTLIKGVGENMTEFILNAAVGEMAKTTNVIEIDWTQTGANYFFGLIADALAIIAEKNVEEDSDYNIYINPKKEAWVRKQLVDNLKYSEDYIRTGAIGAVCGVPIYRSNAIPEDCVYIENSGAMTCFVKKGIETETDRDANTRTNYLYARQVGFVALTDDNKCIALSEATETPVITTPNAGATSVRGSSAAKATVVLYYDGGEEIGTTTAGSSGAWEVDFTTALASGDKIYAVAFEAGKAKATSATVTIA